MSPSIFNNSKATIKPTREVGLNRSTLWRTTALFPMFCCRMQILDKEILLQRNRQRKENPSSATTTYNPNKTPAMSPLLNPADDAEVARMLLDANGGPRGAKRRRDESDSEDRPVREVRRLYSPAQASDATGYPAVHDQAVSSEPFKPRTTSVTLHQRPRRRRYTKTVADWGKRGNMKRQVFKEWIPYPADESSASEDEDEDIPLTASIAKDVADVAPVSIQDIMTDPTSSLTTYAIINDNDNLDRLEFSIGIERGGIVQYSDSPLLRVALREDMVELLHQTQWALIPSSDTLRLIQQLFIYNHRCAPRHRLKFTQVIPTQDEYEYRLFCPLSEDSPVFYIQGQRYAYPFKDLPTVHCSLHPCFAIPSALRFFNKTFMLGIPKTNEMDEAHLLCCHVGCALGTVVYASWVKTTSTKALGRPVPLARYDPVEPSDPPAMHELLASAIAANANANTGVETK